MTTIVNQKLEKREKMIDIFVGSKTDDKGNEETDDKTNDKTGDTTDDKTDDEQPDTTNMPDFESE